MADGGSERPHKNPIRYCCGGTCKSGVHGTAAEAKSCAVHHLTAVRGLKQLGPREFLHENGSILVLSKKPQRAKAGKAGRAMTSGIHER